MTPRNPWAPLLLWTLHNYYALDAHARGTNSRGEANATVPAARKPEPFLFCSEGDMTMADILAAYQHTDSAYTTYDNRRNHYDQES